MYSTPSLPPTGASRKRWKRGGGYGRGCATPGLPRKVWIAVSTTAVMSVRAWSSSPAVHEGVSVREMEKKGIHTEKGDFNRWVRSANAKLRSICQKISELLAWPKEAKAELSKPQEPMLADLLGR